MTRPFVHLHLHSHFSLLDSAIRLDELVKQVAAYEMPAVALTDHGNLFGAYEFYSAARKAGVRPVLGCEVYVAPGSRTERSGNPHGARKPYHHLVLLAESQRGWHNLMQLVTAGYLEGFYHRPRIDKELLATHAEGLIGLSACNSGEVASRLLAGDEAGARQIATQYKEIFGKDAFFLEMQDHGMADQQVVREGVRRLGTATGIPIVATNDCHFHRRDDVEAHKVLLGIGYNKTLTDMATEYVYNDEFYVKSQAEMARLFAEDTGVLERTVEIAGRCHVSFA
jgi:DNA polymerase-3 subunit alpha